MARVRELRLDLAWSVAGIRHRTRKGLQPKAAQWVRSCIFCHEIEPKVNKWVLDLPVCGFKEAFLCMGGCNGEFHTVCHCGLEPVI